VKDEKLNKLTAEDIRKFMYLFYKEFRLSCENRGIPFKDGLKMVEEVYYTLKDFPELEEEIKEYTNEQEKT